MGDALTDSQIVARLRAMTADQVLADAIETLIMEGRGTERMVADLRGMRRTIRGERSVDEALR